MERPLSSSTIIGLFVLLLSGICYHRRRRSTTTACCCREAWLYVVCANEQICRCTGTGRMYAGVFFLFFLSFIRTYHIHQPHCCLLLCFVPSEYHTPNGRNDLVCLLYAAVPVFIYDKLRYIDSSVKYYRWLLHTPTCTYSKSIAFLRFGPLVTRNTTIYTPEYWIKRGICPTEFTIIHTPVSGNLHPEQCDSA